MNKSILPYENKPSTIKCILVYMVAGAIFIGLGFGGLLVFPGKVFGATAQQTEQPVMVQTFASGEALLTMTGPDGLDGSFGLVLDGVPQRDYPVKGGAKKQVILHDLMPQMAVTLNPPADGDPITAITPPPASLFVAPIVSKVKPTKTKTVVQMRNRSNSETVYYTVTAMDRTGSHQWHYTLEPLTKLVKHTFSGLTKGTIIYTTMSNSMTTDNLDICRVKASGICR